MIALEEELDTECEACFRRGNFLESTVSALFAFPNKITPGRSEDPLEISRDWDGNATSITVTAINSAVMVDRDKSLSSKLINH